MQINHEINPTNVYTRIYNQTNLQAEPGQAKNSIFELVADIKNNLNELYQSENLLDLSERIKQLSENKERYYKSKFLGFIIKLFSKIRNFKLHREFKTSAQICGELADRMAAVARRRVQTTVPEEPLPVLDPFSNSHTDAIAMTTQQPSLENQAVEEEDTFDSECKSDDDEIYSDMQSFSPEELERLGMTPDGSESQVQVDDLDEETESTESTDDDSVEFSEMREPTSEEMVKHGINPEYSSPIHGRTVSPMAMDSDREDSGMIEEQTNQTPPQNEEMDLESRSRDDTPEKLDIGTVPTATPDPVESEREHRPRSLISMINEALNSGIAEADQTLGAWCTVIFNQIFSGVEITGWRRNSENDYTITLNQEMVGHLPQLPGAGILKREFRVQFSTREIDGKTCPVINLPNGGIAQRTGSGWLSIDTHVYSLTVIPGTTEDTPNVRISTRLITQDVPANFVSEAWMQVEWNQ